MDRKANYRLVVGESGTIWGKRRDAAQAMQAIDKRFLDLIVCPGTKVIAGHSRSCTRLPENVREFTVDRTGSNAVLACLTPNSEIPRGRSRIVMDENSKFEKAIAIAATFTAEPVKETLAFWMTKLNIPSRICFAPYNQVFQQLLDPASLFARNQNGVNVVLLRFEDWLRCDGTIETQGNHRDALEERIARLTRGVEDLVAAARSAAGRSQTPHLILLCPAAPSTLADPRRALLQQRLELRIRDELEATPGFLTVLSEELAALYPVADYYDSHGEEMAHIPYTSLLFAALGSLIARRIHALWTAPYKVIVLDCDQTLWRGVCGEDGAAGVEIDAPRRVLQEFMLRQKEAGRLLCLCSKNREDDVFSVFRQQSRMPLRREDIVAWRLNWNPKPDNLRSLADELGLGLESFVFLDDSPLECAEVQDRCPEVLTLQLPQDAAEIPRFLEHSWAFDHLKITAEDRQRPLLYQQESLRERWRRQSLTLADFFAGLALEVGFSEPQPAQFDRVAQLTQRTNQFNTTTIRRSAAEIADLCRSQGLECLVTEVSDRFGCYGLVGLLVFRSAAEALEVESFLLSCRALGRGVEHRMLARLGEIARQRRLGYVEVSFLPTLRNQPVYDFLRSVGARFEQARQTGSLFRLPADVAASLSFVPSASKGESRLSAAVRGGKEGLDSDWRAPLGVLRQIAVEFHDLRKILGAATAAKERSRPKSGGYLPPRTPLERALADIWRQVLAVRPIGVFDTFFELGGTSLQAAQLITRIEKLLGACIHIAVLYDRPTIADMAEFLRCEYPGPLRAVLGADAVPPAAAATPACRISEVDLQEFRRTIQAARSSAPASDSSGKKNRRAVFVLSPPRSGSTLLRVMLAGHPRLFAPPELELLSFDTLQSRDAAFSGRYEFWREGTLRALMEIFDCDAGRAREIMLDCVASGLSTRQFYGKIQQWIGDRLLVDKTPSYALDPRTLNRGEEYFEGALYLHLVRHPCGVIRSFEKCHLEQVLFLPGQSIPSRVLAELTWVVSEQNILAFLPSIPHDRQFTLRYEELVRNPRRELGRVCDFLGVPFDPAVLDPYADAKSRMSDGIYAESRMLGDRNFHNHQRVDAAAAERWKDEMDPDSLAEVTRRLGVQLGYGGLRGPTRIDRSAERRRQGRGTVHGFHRHTLPMVHGKTAVVVGDGRIASILQDYLPPENPLYWCELPGTDGSRVRCRSIEEIAAGFCDRLPATGPQDIVLLGYSLGGVVAYEMACQLALRGESSPVLVLIEPRIGREERLSSKVQSTLDVLKSLPWIARAAYLLAKVRDHSRLRWRKLTFGVDALMGRKVPPALRWDYVRETYKKLIAGYAPRPLPGRMVLLEKDGYPSQYHSFWRNLAAGTFCAQRVRCKSRTDCPCRPSGGDHLCFVLCRELDEQWTARVTSELTLLHPSMLPATQC